MRRNNRWADCKRHQT